MSKLSLIIRDVLYAIIIVLLLLPTNPTNLNIWLKILLIVIAVAQRTWQHVAYYKQTGRIY